MIRIEGIPILAARLAALKTAKVTETARVVRQPQTRQRPFPTPSTTVRRRKLQPSARVSA